LALDEFTLETLTLRGKEFPVRVGYMPQHQLSFYLENPRLYSLLRADGQDPTQGEIQAALGGLEHVKQLVQSIKVNGGLIDPVIVLDESFVVLEGNSRLAAYRILAESEGVAWAKIKVKILPKDIGESAIFSLLGEYHIIGKRDWAPFEQAGYLYRRHRHHNISVPTLVREIGLPKATITHLIETYEFMRTHKETDSEKWSYYDEYLKSSKIRRAREAKPELDKVVVDQIQSEEIPRAIDVREKLALIVQAGGKTLDRYVSGKYSFEDACENARDRGAGNEIHARLKKFKEWIVKATTEEDILDLKGEVRHKCAFELDKIKKKTDKLCSKLES
jgi:ParB-like nuclease family protein